MAVHGSNYVRQVGKDGQEIGKLKSDCGHHCGVIPVGHSTQTRHCTCPECHNDKKAN